VGSMTMARLRWIAAVMIAGCLATGSARADEAPRDDRGAKLRVELLGGYGPGFELGGRVGHAPRFELGAGVRRFRFGATVQPYFRAVWKNEPDQVVLRPSAFVGGRLELDHGLALAFDALLGASRFLVTNSEGLFSPATEEATRWLPSLGARARFTYAFRSTMPVTVMIGAEIAVYADLGRRAFNPRIEGVPAEAGGVGVYPGLVAGGTWRSASAIDP
jgi:hypothetical protein